MEQVEKVLEKVLEKNKKLSKCPPEIINLDFIHYAIFKFGAVECFNWTFQELPDYAKTDKRICQYFIRRGILNVKQIPLNWTNKNEYIEVILMCLEKEPRDACFLTEEYKDCKEIFMKILPLNGEVLKEASERLQDDEEVVLTAVRTRISSFEFQRMRNQTIYAPLNYASIRIRSNIDIVKESLNYSYDNFFFIAKSIQFEKTFLLEVLEEHPLLLEYINPKLVDLDLVKTAVTKDGNSLGNIFSLLSNFFSDFKFMNSYAPRFNNEKDPKDVYNRFLSNIDVARIACITCGRLYPFLPSNLKKDRKIALSCVKQNGMIANYIKEEEFLQDIEFALAAVKENVDSLQFFPHFKDNVQVLMMVSKINNLLTIEMKDIHFNFIDPDDE